MLPRIAAVTLVLTFGATPRSERTASGAQATPVEFARDIRPILEAHCEPCHFTGGKMYARLPFDRPETIRKLG